MIAHRGASFDAPENTLAAIREAIVQGSDAIELDAQMSADGKVVLVHDGSVNRTTDGEGHVKGFTLEALKLLDAGSWFNEVFAGERIPTLREGIREIGGRAQLMIDSKGADPLAVRRILLEEGVDLGGVVVFNWGAGQATGYLRHFPECEYMPTFLRLPADWGEGSAASWKRRGARGFATHQVITTRALRRQTALAGMQVVAWTVNAPERALQLAWLGVDGIITDRPALIRQAIEAADLDGDGLEDLWEAENAGSGGLESAGDDDGDGLENRWEQSAGTHPLRPDSDGDGLPDGWEWRRGWGPADPGSPAPETGLAAWAFGPDEPHWDAGMDGISVRFRLRDDPRLDWCVEWSSGIEHWAETDEEWIETVFEEEPGWRWVVVKIRREALPGPQAYLRIRLRYG